jgi:hypothetical protein
LGQLAFTELTDSIRTYNATRLMVAEARIEREKRLAEPEALAGVDVETLGQSAGAQTEQPASTKVRIVFRS